MAWVKQHIYGHYIPEVKPQFWCDDYKRYSDVDRQCDYDPTKEAKRNPNCPDIYSSRVCWGLKRKARR